MSNTSQRTIVVLALSVGLLLAAVSGGATYAAFTDSGSVDVTFTAGNITDSSEETPTATNERGPNDPDNETDDDTTNGSNTTNETDDDTTNGSNTTNETDDDTTNEMSENGSEQISDEGIPTPNGPETDRRNDAISADVAIDIEYRTGTTVQLSIDG